MRRPAWTRGDQAHIQISGPVEPGAARRLEAALQAVDGVRWAAYNGVLDRVVVSLDPAGGDLRRLVGVVDGVVGAYRPAGDLDRGLSDVVALGGDALAFGAGIVGRALRLVPVPVELAALPAAVSLAPRLRDRVADALGPVRADLLGSLSRSALAAAMQTPLPPVADGLLRLVRAGEDRASRRARARAAPRLYADAGSARASAPRPTRRPSPLPDGEIERYAARASTVTLLATAAVLPAGPRPAARVAAVGAPGAAYHGREAFAARLGQLLAQRGVVVRDHAALRRLDRLDTVILDAGVLTTGRALVAEVLGAPGADEVEAKTRALAMLDAGRPRRVVRRGRWALGPLSRLEVELPGELDDALRRAGQGRRDALGLLRSGRLVAAVTVQAQLDPLAPAVIAAARKVGRVLVAGTGSGIAERLRADGAVAGGSRLATSVRDAQRRNGGVALVSAGNDTALAAADCGIGVQRRDGRPPWGAHLMGGPDLEAAWLALEAAALARRVSGRSSKIAALGSAAGALVLLTSASPAAGRQALMPVGLASLANVIGGAWAASTLGRRAVPVPGSVVPWHALSADDVLRELHTSADGLPDSEVDRRREETVASPPAPGLLRVTVEELDNPLTAPLAAGAAVSTATGGLTDAILVIGVQAANALLGGVQRLAATRALRRLLAASSTRVRLLRGGAAREVVAEELVPGDIVTLQAGDVVPADCRLLHSAGLETDESSLTGESLPVAKSPAPTLAPAVADRTSMVYAGTTVAAGTATAVVTATGRSTEAGRSGEVTADLEPAGGVEARLRRLTVLSLPVAGAAAAAIVAAGLLRGRPGPALGSAVGLAVAAVPEGLPFVATIAQLSAARRLSRRNVLVRSPRTMESLGRLDVVCFDKTGTLTEGRIRLRSVSDGRVSEPAGALGGDRRLVLATALRATPVANGDEVLPHPTDRAVVAGGEDAGIAVDEGAAGWRLLRELPFEPGRGFHAVLGETPHGLMISVKGAPETVLPRCTAWRRSDAADGVRPLTRTDRRRLEAYVEQLASRGLRVLAVAQRPATRRRRLDDDRVERLEFLGLLGLADPVRPTAAEAVGRLRRAGIAAVMLTGDHPGTAEAIAEELGILGERGVVTGPSLDGLDDAEIVELVSDATVFARVSPSHKVTIVRALRRAGRVVAVTGDGANDAPAIRLADVGIALGNPGTDAAREAADIIVTDDRIETIVSAVVEGRAMWVSVRDAVALLLGGNLGEIAFTLGTGLLSPRSALNARQLLLVNLVTDLLPAVAMAARPPIDMSPDDLLREGPDRSLGGALNRDIVRRALATGLAAGAGWAVARTTGTRRRASTVGLASLVMAQLAQTAVASRGDPVVLAAAGLSALALIGTVQSPVTSAFFGCRPLGPIAWAIVAGASGVAPLIATLPLPSRRDTGRPEPEPTRGVVSRGSP